MITEKEAIRLLSDKEWRMSHLYKIKTKDQRLVKYKWNLAQEDYNQNKVSMNIILKARQHGFTTDGLLDMLDRSISTKNTNSAIVAHEQKKVQTLFEIVKRGYENLPEQLRPRVSFDNRNELYFPELDSKIYVALDTRGDTVHNLHISEVAFITNAEEKMTGILESVPKGGRITLESTANGMGGYFFDEWENPHSEFKKHFYNWMWAEEYREPTLKTLDELDAEYRELAVRYGTIQDIRERFQLDKEQFNFYIQKVRRHKEYVMQEYPTTITEAFIAAGRNVFHIVDLNKHKLLPPIDRKYGDVLIWEQPLKGFKYVIGCDVAEGLGGDYSTIEVLNAHTGEQAAEYRSNHIPPDMLGDMLIDIGKMYNNALLVIEINNHGRSVVDGIKRRYSNIYRREIFDKVSQETVQTLGWRTTGTTKPILVDVLEEAIRNEDIKIRSNELMKELRIFVQTDEQGHQGFGAEGSAHDDLVIAIGLAVQGIRHTPKSKRPKTIAEEKLEKYIKTHGIPQLFEGRTSEQGHAQLLTGRNRVNSRLRR